MTRSDSRRGKKRKTASGDRENRSQPRNSKYDDDRRRDDRTSSKYSEPEKRMSDRERPSKRDEGRGGGSIPRGGKNEGRGGGSIPRGGRNGGADIIVRNLPRDFHEDQLRKIFRDYGEILSCTIPQDYVTRKPKSFGFVKFEKDGEADEAVDRMDKASVDGFVLSCARATGRAKSPGYMARQAAERDRRPYTSGGRGEERGRSDRGGRGGRGRERSRRRGNSRRKEEPPREDVRRGGGRKDSRKPRGGGGAEDVRRPARDVRAKDNSRGRRR